MTETDHTSNEIVSVLSSLVRGSGQLSDIELNEQISKRLPEPSAIEPQPVQARPGVVDSVAVQGIRSFGPEQTLHLSEGLTIVYAGNGKGKTSLTDALELVTDGAHSLPRSRAGSRRRPLRVDPLHRSRRTGVTRSPHCGTPSRRGRSSANCPGRGWWRVRSRTWTRCARIVHASEDVSSPDRGRAVDAATADAEGTLSSLRELEFRRTVLSPLLKRAQTMTRTLLVARVRKEFAELEQPINDWLEILGPEGTPRISLEATLTTGRPSLDLLVADLPDGAKAPHATGYFSDAQLDMLGMAAHLARIERDHTGSTIVIDDPSDMLDSTSRKALAGTGIARLLENGERPAHQVLVLTHDDQLVRDLWDGHRHRSPATVQDTMEIRRSADREDSFSVLTSRTTADAVARARALAKEPWEANQDRLWFRAALAAHTLQATEMCAKDVDTLLGPAGMDLHPSNRVPRESDELGQVGDRVRATLRETTASWCESGRHHVARNRIGELLDLLSKSSTQFLNPGAHADVVLPEAIAGKTTLLRLEDAAALLAPPEGRPRSSWTTQSQLAGLLRSSRGCSECEGSE